MNAALDEVKIYVLYWQNIRGCHLNYSVAN